MSLLGGRLSLRTREGRNRTAGEDGLIFTIADTGSGMTRDVSSRIFEPFFTTKGLSSTGLGLWIGREIVERHRGILQVRSSQRENCHGTVLTLFSPWNAGSQGPDSR
jgi:signal transduction histidine kinase